MRVLFLSGEDTGESLGEVWEEEIRICNGRGGKLPLFRCGAIEFGYGFKDFRRYGKKILEEHVRIMYNICRKCTARSHSKMHMKVKRWLRCMECQLGNLS